MAKITAAHFKGCKQYTIVCGNVFVFTIRGQLFLVAKIFDMYDEFFTPVEQSEVISASPDPGKWESKVVFNDVSVTDLGDCQLAIIGVVEERGATQNIGTANAPDEIRKQLYQLALSHYDLKLMDLGNIVAGARLRDTYVGLSKVVNELLRAQVVPIIIGGSQDIAYGQFGAYLDLGKMINVACVDARFDLEPFEGESFNNQSVLGKIITHEPNIIFNLSLIGYQTHFCRPFATETFDKLNYDAYRLGLVRGDASEMEPVLRNVNMFTIDCSAIRFADSPGSAYATPNGLNGEDACQLSYYAGLSNTVSSFGLYEMNPFFDERAQSAQLAAQLIWYFADGFYKRKADLPAEGDANYLKYIIHFKENGYEMVFWKSKRTDRWWMEVMPAQTGKIKPKPVLLPCSYKDYQLANREEIPERWLKAVGKLG